MQLEYPYSFPDDFIVIDFYNAINLPTGYEELICLFTNDANQKFVDIKTYRCDWYPYLNGGELIAFIPEQYIMVANSLTTITVTTRMPVAAGSGIPQLWGVDIAPMP